MVTGSCQDINCTTASLSEGAIYIVGAKQKWIYLHAELQNSELLLSSVIPFHLSPFGILYDFFMFFIQISGNFKERNRCYEGCKSHRFCSHGKKQEANYIHLIVKSFV